MHKTWLNPNESIDIIWGPKEAQIPKHGPGTFLPTNHYKKKKEKKKNNFRKTKDIKWHAYTPILGKCFEISTNLGETLQRELKVHVTSSTHLQILKTAIEMGQKLQLKVGCSFFFSGFLQGQQWQGISEHSLRKGMKLKCCGCCFVRVTFTKWILAN